MGDGCGAGHDGVCGSSYYRDAADIRVRIRGSSNDRHWNHGFHHRRYHVVRNTSLCDDGLHHWHDPRCAYLIPVCDMHVFESSEQLDRSSLSFAKTDKNMLKPEEAAKRKN